MSSTGKITLKSSDGEAFGVVEAVAHMSQVIKHVIEDCETSIPSPDDPASSIPIPIPIYNVPAKSLAKVIEYWKKHADATNSEGKASEDDLKVWVAEFVKADQATLFDLNLAAHYLDIKSLLDLTNQTFADMIRGKTPEEIHKILNTNVITLISSNGEVFIVDKGVVLLSQTMKNWIEIIEDKFASEDMIKALEWQSIKHMIKDICRSHSIPLPNVTGEILAKVIEYCKKHSDSVNPGYLQDWDAEFVKVDQATLFDLILAANYLNIESLLDLTTQAVGDMIKGMTGNEIKKIFKIKNDFTPEEEEEVRRENQWAVE